MKKLLALLLIFNIIVVAAPTQTTNSVDCIILEDENSIVCKYITKRSSSDKEVIVQWINPNNEVSRERNMLVPAGHASIYDFRYKSGRAKGEWIFKVIDNSKEYTTTFTIE